MTIRILPQTPDNIEVSRELPVRTVSRIVTERGLSAYEIAVRNGYPGTEADWVNLIWGYLNYDISLFIQGFPTDSELVLRIEVGRGFTIAASAIGSQASARIASLGNVSFDLRKNDVSFGSIDFNISAEGIFSVASSVTFVAGDILTVLAPATADVALRDISITLVGSRT